MSTNYPNDYDSYPTWQDLVDIIAAAIINNIQDAIVAIEHELGKNPSGDYATVKERLDNIPSGGRWQLVEEVKLTSPVSSYTFNNLDGDSDKEYLLFVRIRAQTGTTHNWKMRFNGDSGNNYFYSWHENRAGSCYCGYNNYQNGIVFMFSDANPQMYMGEVHIFAESGYERMIMSQFSVYWTPDNEIRNVGQRGGGWRNTGSNITSITIFDDGGQQMLAGTVLQLWKRA